LPRTTAPSGYGTLSGTSMASPHVAGVLALMKSAHPDWTPGQMIAKLRQEADDKACSATTAGAVCVGPEADNSYFGEGMVDALDGGSGPVTPVRPGCRVDGPRPAHPAFGFDRGVSCGGAPTRGHRARTRPRW